MLLSFNKKKYIKKIYKNKFANKTYFRNVYLTINNERTDFIIKIVNTIDDLTNYVAPLNYVDEKIIFLLKPQFSFDTKEFASSIDLIFFDSKFLVKEVKLNVNPGEKFYFDKKLYNILVLRNNVANFLKIKTGDKIKLNSKNW